MDSWWPFAGETCDFGDFKWQDCTKRATGFNEKQHSGKREAAEENCVIFLFDCRNHAADCSIWSRDFCKRFYPYEPKAPIGTTDLWNNRYISILSRVVSAF